MTGFTDRKRFNFKNLHYDWHGALPASLQTAGGFRLAWKLKGLGCRQSTTTHECTTTNWFPNSIACKYKTATITMVYRGNHYFQWFTVCWMNSKSMNDVFNKDLIWLCFYHKCRMTEFVLSSLDLIYYNLPNKLWKSFHRGHQDEALETHEPWTMK